MSRTIQTDDEGNEDDTGYELYPDMAGLSEDGLFEKGRLGADAQAPWV